MFFYGQKRQLSFIPFLCSIARTTFLFSRTVAATFFLVFQTENTGQKIRRQSFWYQIMLFRIETRKLIKND